MRLKEQTVWWKLEVGASGKLRLEDSRPNVGFVAEYAIWTGKRKKKAQQESRNE